MCYSFQKNMLFFPIYKNLSSMDITSVICGPDQVLQGVVS